MQSINMFFCNFASMKGKKIILSLVILAFFSCKNNSEQKTVICIPVYGQSLALGVEANRITDFDSLAKYADGRIVTEDLDHQFGYYNLSRLKQFVKKKFHLRNYSSELTVYSMAQWLADHTGEDTIICIFPGGQDGTIISNLGKDSEPYQKLIKDIKTAYKSARSNGWEFEMPALCWMQGESNMCKYSEDNYKKLFLKFQKDINSDVKQITNQKKDVDIICYQTNSLARAKHFNPIAYNCPEMVVPQTQLELIRDNPLFHASGPTYPYDCVNDIIHIDGCGQQRHGILAALAALDILRHQDNRRGLFPNKIEYGDTEVIIEFNIPCPPLKFDTIQVVKVDNFGFSVITPDNRNIAQEATIQENNVHINCSEQPKGCRVRYAVNGDYMKSGRLYGPRGNLRDSQGDSLLITIQGKDYPIYNWCYQFDIPIE